MNGSFDQNIRAVRRLNRIGLTAVTLLFGGVGGWAAMAPLSGAVIASGVVAVESHVKRVQHPNGGVVGQIMVREGSQVTEGDIVLRLDDTLVRANLGVVRTQLDELLAREARLLAEREETASIVFPEKLIERRQEGTVQRAITGEEKLFEARRTTRAGLKEQYRQRIGQLEDEVRGLAAQRGAKEQEIAFISEELKGVDQLYTQKLVSISRFMLLKRDRTRLEGERGNLTAETARSRGKISEIEVQIIQVEQEFRSDVLKDLRDTQGKIAELQERAIAAEDQLRRIDIRAPQSGVVHQLAVFTVGGVVQAGEVIMQIVPKADDLIIEARVAPTEVDQVREGLAAHIRISAGNQRTMPDLNGHVVNVGADLTRDQQSNTAYFVVRITLDPGETARLGSLVLQPGMPAESFIQTETRTALEYLVKPLREQIARTFKER